MSTRLGNLALSAALALTALGGLEGCRPALVPLTQEMRDQVRLSEAELKNLQFYVSHTITLRRELDAGSRQVTGNHKLVMVAGKMIEEVVIEAKTPGICVGVDGGRLSIAFEQGTSIDFVPQATRSAQGPGGFATAPDADPFPGNGRVRAADPRVDGLFTGAYTIAVDGRGTVGFMGKRFDAVDETSNATLLIDAQSLERVVKQHKVLPGLRLPSR
jgi:hypothetical protein